MEWAERQLLIYSPALAQSGYRGLEQRLKQAEAKLAARMPESGKSKRAASDQTELHAQVEAILTK